VLDLRHLRVAYGDTVAVDDVDLHVAAGEVVALLGPSGCGKSSLLRAVAGLEAATGRVCLDGRDLADVPPHRRGVGLMFQGEALFPHRDVGGNVAFGLRMLGWDRADVDARVAWALALVGLPGTEGRAVDTLSGGEQQRVALARAVAPRPRLLMLDEPLSSVDRALRDRLLEELPRVFAEVDAAVVYVTHDQSEALALADRVAVMRAGRVVQEGPPPDVWQQPASRFVATFLGLRPLEEVAVVDEVAATAIGPVPAPGRPDGPASVVVPPGAVRPAGAGDTGARVEAVVEARRFAGDHVVVVARTDDGTALEVAWHAATWPAVGAPLTLAVDVDRLVVVDAD
jgi:thiamine transport system ATP-binding protein